MRILTLLVLLAFGAPSLAGEVLVAQASHDRGLYHVEVDMRLDAPKAEVWRMLTDFAHYNQLNEAIQLSEVLEQRNPEDYRVRTVTDACVYLFCKTLVQVQDVIEVNNSYLAARVLPELSHFRYGLARAYVWEEGVQTRVRVLAEVEPDFWIPPLIGPWLITSKLRSEALETVRNLERLHQAATR
jgi:hypothetical protein